MPPPPRLVLLFDFDGTLYTGDLPILAYARHAAGQLPEAAATELIDGIRFFLEGRSVGASTIDLAAAEDGYQAVEILAASAGLTQDQVSHAYRAARADLARSAFALEAPAGLADLLRELEGCHVMVVTNADPDGVSDVLEAVGVAPFVHELITDAGKPVGMGQIVQSALRRIDPAGDPRRLLLVGDRWTNDLLAGHLAGAATAMIDRFDRRDGTPTHRAADLASLIPVIRAWADDFGDR